MGRSVWIPVLILVAVVTRNFLVPPGLIGPDRDFLYAIVPDTYYFSGYVVQSGELVQGRPRRLNADPNHPSSVTGSFEDVRLFVHRTRWRDRSHDVSFEAARRFTFDSNVKDARRIGLSSPRQGFRVLSNKNYCGFGSTILCAQIDPTHVWLEGWGMSRRLNITFSDERRFEFVGWIVSGRA